VPEEEIWKFVLFYDGAPWHKEEKIEEFFEKNRGCIIPVFFPRGSPELNAVEECWRQGSILGSTHPPSFGDLEKSVSCYYCIMLLLHQKISLKYNQLFMSLTIDTKKKEGDLRYLAEVK